MIIIRADGNTNIGMGHIMRCLSVALALREIGAAPRWITADPEAKEIIKSHGFACSLTGYSYDQMNRENWFIKSREEGCEKILLDSYQADEPYMETLKKYGILFYLDDEFRFKYPADFIINYNLNAFDLGYGAFYRAEQLLLGPDYLPLRPEFQNIPSGKNTGKNRGKTSEKTCKNSYNEVKNILITTGGSDPSNICPALLRTLAPAFPGITFHVVIGPFFKNQRELLAPGYKNAAFHHSPKNIASLMALCDIAVSAGGSTLYELCACGLPSIAFSIAPNQQKNLAAFAARKALISAGNWDACSPANILNELNSLIANHDTRLSLSARARAVVDGNGALRTARFILSR